jgi:hypothetical protein
MKRVGLQEEALVLEEASNRLNKKINSLLAGDDDEDGPPQLQLQVDLDMGTTEEASQAAQPQSSSSHGPGGD